MIKSILSGFLTLIGLGCIVFGALLSDPVAGRGTRFQVLAFVGSGFLLLMFSVRLRR